MEYDSNETPIIYIDEKLGWDRIIVAINDEFEDRNQIKNR
jgi:hypothetical protein